MEHSYIKIFLKQVNYQLNTCFFDINIYTLVILILYIILLYYV